MHDLSHVVRVETGFLCVRPHTCRMRRVFGRSRTDVPAKAVSQFRHVRGDSPWLQDGQPRLGTVLAHQVEGTPIEHYVLESQLSADLGDDRLLPQSAVFGSFERALTTQLVIEVCTILKVADQLLEYLFVPPHTSLAPGLLFIDVLPWAAPGAWDAAP